MSTVVIRRLCARCGLAIYVNPRDPMNHCLRCFSIVTEEERENMSTETIIDITDSQLAPSEDLEDLEDKTPTEPAAASDKAHVNGSSGGGKPKRARRPPWAKTEQTAEPKIATTDSVSYLDTVDSRIATFREELKEAIEAKTALNVELLKQVDANAKAIGELQRRLAKISEDAPTNAESLKAIRGHRAEVARKSRKAAAAKPGGAKSARLARRSPEQIAEALGKVVALIKSSKTPLRAENIREALKLDAKEMPRILKEGLKTKVLKKTGSYRATVYTAR